MKLTPSFNRMRMARGFSLIELLIGIVIGLVGLLAIFQVVTVWDSHNRTTTAGGDADVGGTLAMFTLERDIKQAGLGMKPTVGTQLNCNGTGIQVNDTVSGASTLRFAPVEIVAGAGGVPDQINVFYGNTSFMPAPEVFSLSTATTKTITPNRYGFRPGDLVIVAGNPTEPCSLVEITAGATLGGLVTHAPGNYATYYPTAPASSAAARFNGTAGTTTAYSGTGTLFNLGPAPQFDQWTINATGVLQRSERIFGSGAAAIDVAEGVINMKAQYGLDADDNQLISTAEWTATSPTAGNWANVLAVRVAILVRSKQWERSASGSASGVPTPVTPTAPQPSWVTCGNPPTCGGFLMTNIDGTPDSNLPGDPNNWRYYRYRVYEKVIPLRNMIWGAQ